MLLFKQKSGHTWSQTHVNFQTKEVYQWVWQISRKDPWWLPRKKEHIASGVYYPLYGWLFFYIGRVTTGVVYETTEQTKLQDKQGRYYFVHALANEAEQKDVRAAVLCGMSITVTTNETETEQSLTERR